MGRRARVVPAKEITTATLAPGDYFDKQLTFQCVHNKRHTITMEAREYGGGDFPLCAIDGGPMTLQQVEINQTKPIVVKLTHTDFYTNTEPRILHAKRGMGRKRPARPRR